MKEKQKELYVDVEKVLRNKNYRLAKNLPSFLIKYLKKIIHQDEMNAFLQIHGKKKNADFSSSILEFMNIRYTIIGKENIPLKGRFVFVSNHPLGGMDGIILIDYFQKKYSLIKFPVNDLLLNVKNFEDIFIPINKHGSQSKKNILLLNKTYESDVQILMFPAGIVSRKRNRKISDLPWEKSFLSKAIQYQRDIIPMHISGRNSSFFYNLANIRTFLGIKANFEMLFLPKEMFKQKNNSFTITIGKPISFKYFDKTKNTEYIGMSNIGFRPTVCSKNRLSVEIHIFKFNKEIYGDMLRFSFFYKVREEKKFQNLQDLKIQLNKDKTFIKNLFKAHL